MRSGELVELDLRTNPLLDAYGESAVCGQLAVTQMLQQDYKGPGGLWRLPLRLNPPEQRALNYMVQGLTKEEMSPRLILTPASVKVTKARLYSKLGLAASSPMRAVRTGIEHGLLKLKVVSLDHTEQVVPQLEPYQLLLADLMSRNIPSVQARQLAGSKIVSYRKISNTMNQLLDVLDVHVGDRHREDRAVREAREGAAVMRLYSLGIFKKGLTRPSALLTTHGD